MGKSLFLTVIYAVCSLCYMAAQGLVNVKHYSVKDGMSQNTVQEVLQDNEGLHLDGYLERTGKV